MAVLITGASSGIGAALARELAGRGERLFLCGRDRMRLDETVAACRALGAVADGEVVDVTDGERVRTWMEGCDAISPLGCVYANAGVAAGREDEDAVRRVFAVNVGGVVETVLAAQRIFRRRPSGGVRGHIVITSSIAGYAPLATCPAYSATKSCVRVWALALRQHLAGEGIRVTVVCPGFVRSRITDRNTCPMPFFMEAPAAARRILSGVARNRAIVAFPWPMRLLAYLASVLPWRLQAMLNRMLPPRTSAGEVRK